MSKYQLKNTGVYEQENLNYFSQLSLKVIDRPFGSGVESTLQRKNAENWKQIFPEKEYRGLSPNFHIDVSVSELYIPTMELPFLLEEICGPMDPGNI
jgi:hypothetical protein